MRFQCVCLNIIIFLNNLLLLLRSTNGQTILLAYSNVSASCNGTELIEGSDFIILIGTVDLETGSATDWKLDIPIQYQVNSASPFQTVCIVRMISFCANDGTNCYCTSKSGTKYNFIVNLTATTMYSGATMRAELARYDATDVKRNTTLIPHVHGKEKVNFTIEDATLDVNYCSRTLKKDTSYRFSFCAYNLKNPNVSMQFGADSVQFELGECITRTRTAPTSDCVFNYTFRYSDDCQRSKTYSQSYNVECPDDPDIIIGLSVALGVALLLVIILFIILMKVLFPNSFCRSINCCPKTEQNGDISNAETGTQLQSMNKTHEG